MNLHFVFSRAAHTLTTRTLALSLATAALAACSVYAPEISQGNIIKAEQVAALKTGMNKQAVLQTLGSPMLQDMYSANRWDYVYRYVLNSATGDAPGTPKDTLTLSFDANNRLNDWSGRAPGALVATPAPAPVVIAPAPRPEIRLSDAVAQSGSVAPLISVSGLTPNAIQNPSPSPNTNTIPAPSPVATLMPNLVTGSGNAVTTAGSAAVPVVAAAAPVAAPVVAPIAAPAPSPVFIPAPAPVVAAPILSPAPAPAPAPVTVNYAIASSAPAATAASLNPALAQPAVELALANWQRAWASKNLPDYFNSYAAGYKSDAVNAEGWQAWRRQVLGNAGKIILDLGKPTYAWSGADRVQVQFSQSYRSDVFRQSGQKTLTFQNINGEYKIVSEVFSN